MSDQVPGTDVSRRTENLARHHRRCIHQRVQTQVGISASCRFPPSLLQAFLVFPGNIGCKNKNPSQRISERDHVLRTGIEPHMIISKLPYLQAVLQAIAQ